MNPRELSIKNQLYNQYKKNKRDFVSKYGSEAEKVMLGRAITLAKNMVDKQDKLKIKETIKNILSSSTIFDNTKSEMDDDINSVDFIKSRHDISSPSLDLFNQNNNSDQFKEYISLSIPLLIRIMEYSREDASNDLDLHFVLENIIQLSKSKNILNMSDYESLVSPYIKSEENE